VQISSQSRPSCAVLCHSLLTHPADASVLTSTRFIPINPYKSTLPEDDQGLFYCIWRRRLRSDGHGVGGIRRRGGGGEREEKFVGSKKKKRVGLRVKWYWAEGKMVFLLHSANLHSATTTPKRVIKQPRICHILHYLKRHIFYLKANKSAMHNT
jgi:hypothetical protein